MNKSILVSVIALLLGGCAAGPDYARPASELPESWNETVQAEASLDAWWQAFNDERLVSLIEEGLGHNNDLRIAVANVDAAAAALRLARADYLPTANAQLSGTRTRVPGGDVSEVFAAGLIVNYELDIWGRVRRANEAALAELSADMAVRDGVRAGVAAAIAQAYFETRALERQVALLERVHETRLDNLRLQQTRLDAGLISRYDYEQARSETQAVAAALPALRNAHARTLTALAVLRGHTPAQMVAEWRQDIDTALHTLPDGPTVPMGLPSEILERRPDIRAAENRLIAANARIGEAKASYFPRLSLTGFAGSVSEMFSNLFESPTRSWEASVALTQPLTDINRVSARVKAANARHEAALAFYARTVQVAFQETLDALSGVQSAREILRAQDERVLALSSAYESAVSRYRAGRIGYLELLDVERQLRDVEQQQVAAQLQMLQSTVALYRALGGGWQQVGPDYASAAMTR